MVSPELVLFAIQAGIHLGQEARRAYMDLTRDRAVDLPLPDADLGPDIPAAVGFFQNEGARFIEQGTPVERLFNAALVGLLGPADEDRFLKIYVDLITLHNLEATGGSLELKGEVRLDADAFSAMVRIRAYADDSPESPDVLGRVAGTLIELGIDYFVSVPGSLDKDSKNGRIVYGFLDGLKDVPFAEIGLDREGLTQIAGQLFVAALHTLGDQADAVVSDRRMQSLIKVAAHGLSQDIAKALKDAPDGNQRDRIRAWGEVVFRSLLSSAGKAVVAEPGKYFGVEDPLAQKMIQKVGGTLIALAIESGPYNIDELFSRDTLEKLVTVSLEVVADHPELLVDGHEGLQKLIGAVASDLAKVDGLISPDIVPEVTSILLRQTGKHLELLWPDAANDPGKHLLLTAAKTTLALLSDKPDPSANWQLVFTRADVLVVVDTVLGELAENPTWLRKTASNVDANLGAAVGAILEVLRERADDRLSPTTAAAMLAEAIKAVAMRQAFLDPIEPAKPAIASVIDIVIAKLFDSGLDDAAQWQLLRRQAVTALVAIALERLAGATLDQDALNKLGQAIDMQVQATASGTAINFKQFDHDLKQLLQ